MEHVERIKMQQISETSESSAVGRVRWERISLFAKPLSYHTSSTGSVCGLFSNKKRCFITFFLISQGESDLFLWESSHHLAEHLCSSQILRPEQRHWAQRAGGSLTHRSLAPTQVSRWVCGSYLPCDLSLENKPVSGSGHIMSARKPMCRRHIHASSMKSGCKRPTYPNFCFLKHLFHK